MRREAQAAFREFAARFLRDPRGAETSYSSDATYRPGKSRIVGKHEHCQKNVLTQSVKSPEHRLLDRLEPVFSGQGK
jgi:hypothetical protein